MAQFIEITSLFNRTLNSGTMAQRQVADNAPVMIAVAHIVAVAPHWDEDEIWRYTDVCLSNGQTFKTPHLTDEIEHAICSEPFCARVLSD